MSVTLRKRRLISGKVQLYLDIYRYGQRKTESLQMYLDADRFHNRETLRMAETVRAKRELEVQAELHGLTATHNRKSDVIAYMNRLMEKRVNEGTRSHWKSAITKLSDFGSNGIVFGDITRGFVENYKDFLLTDLEKSSSAKVYFQVFKTALNQAVRDGILGQARLQAFPLKAPIACLCISLLKK